MRSQSLISVLFHAIAICLLVSSAAAGLPHGRRVTEPVRDSWVPRFMRLAWLRDSIADFFFNRSSSGSNSGSLKPLRTQWYDAATSAKYAQQTVIRFNVATPDEETALAAAAKRFFLDIWSFNNYTGTVDILLDKEAVAPLLTLLPESLHRSFTPLMSDLAAAVRNTYPRLDGLAGSTPLSLTGPGSLPDEATVSRDGGTDNVFFRDYQPYPVIVQWMKLLDVMFPFVNVVSVGESAEGREILGLRVGMSNHETSGQKKAFGSDDGDMEEEDDDGFVVVKKENSRKSKDTSDKNGRKQKERSSKRKPTPVGAEEPPKKRTILITGGLHAREWISSSSVSYIAWAIITGYGHSNIITKLIDNFDIVFVPVVNPDGYEYTWQTDRLWRKTRQSTNFRYCRGYDLDHAFGYEWNSKTPDEPCSESYGGESAFQAVEAQTFSAWARNEVETNNVKFIGFLDLHSYSQQILFPFSYSCAADPPNLENLEELAAGLAKAIRLSTGETYSVSSACEGVMNLASGGGGASSSMRIESGGGSAIDWFYHELHAKYSYQIKLRDTGSYGFLLPSSEIVPTGEEVFSAVKYFGDFLLGNNGIEKSLESSSSVDVKGETAEEAFTEATVGGSGSNSIYVTEDADPGTEQPALRLFGRRRR
ncbi:Putative metallocarboxypeptidase ecm14 [Sporothrix epigloea]|uniref:Inactive metallocarboxypeptidase ECM14 n=1 Tax=Sporothrix epigloea TaxID=1892477 RepID=A0ABP0DPA0_9PEZI